MITIITIMNVFVSMFALGFVFNRLDFILVTSGLLLLCIVIVMYVLFHDER